MKLYIVEHEGEYLPGYTIALAEDEEQARIVAREEIKSDWEIRRVYDSGLELDGPNAVMIWNGDY